MALALMLSGRRRAEPALVVSQLALWLSGCLFAINVSWNLRSAAEPAAANVAAARA